MKGYCVLLLGNSSIETDMEGSSFHATTHTQWSDVENPATQSTKCLLSSRSVYNTAFSQATASVWTLQTGAPEGDSGPQRERWL